MVQLAMASMAPIGNGTLELKMLGPRTSVHQDR